MREIKLNKVSEVLNGNYRGSKSLEDKTLKGISVDSRTIRKNELFFALKGERFDGHDFVKEAIHKSKLPAVVSRKVKEEETILVKDTLKSLGDVALYYKKIVDPSTIAVTGSYGKTTTKEFIGSIFLRNYSTLVSFKNYNNLIGVPLNLFRLESEEIAVLELGSNQIGEINRLSEIVEPDIALITGIGSTHLKTFKNREGVLKEKMGIKARLQGPLFVNGDDPLLGKIDGDEVIKVGLSENNDITFKILQESVNGSIFSTKGMDFWIKLPTPGMAKCAMLAVAVALNYGIKRREIQEGLAAVEKPSHRVEIEKTNRFNIVDDTYNSNPDSLLNAISFLSLMPGRKLVVLGPMLELGEKSFSIHKKMGEKLRFKVHDLIVIGEEAKGFIEGFGGGHFAWEKEEALKVIQEVVRKGDTVLFKSSRALKLETLVQKVREMDCFTFSTL